MIEEVTLHPIAILEAQAIARIQEKGREVAVVAPCIPFQLMRRPTERVEIVPDKEQAVVLPGGWTGMDPVTGTAVSFDPLVTRAPKAAPAIGIHPPWRRSPGRARLTWRISLPSATPVTFSTAVAIRDTLAPEPPSDGVTFRVLVDGQTLFATHSSSMEWEEARVDLSPFAGKEIGLALESDVGPNVW